MSEKTKISIEELQFRTIKDRERMKFYDYAFESTRDYSESIIGINFDMLRKICKINSILLGLPFKILVRNMKDIFVELRGEIVAGYTLVFDKKKDEYELGNLFTRPDFQGRGIGNAVMQKVVEECGDKKIKLSVNASNEVAIHLYHKYGFKKESEIKEYFHEVPLKTTELSNGFEVRLAIKEDMDKLERIMTELPDMQDLAKHYRKTIDKAESKKLRLQNHLSAVLIQDKEIIGIGRAIWSKALPETAQIFAIAFLPEAKEAYPNFISFLTEEVEKYGIKKFSWANNKKTEHFAPLLEPYLEQPSRIGLTMIKES